MSVTVPCRRLSVASNASGNSSTSHTSHNSRESGHHVPRMSEMDTHLSPAKILGPPEHHTRSCSFRNRPRPKALEIVTDRPRRNSMPSPSRNLLSVSYDNLHDSRGENGEGGLRRVRSFKTTSKGLVNRGDSFKKKSTNSLISTGSTVISENGQSHPKDQEQRERAPSSASNESGTALSVESTNAPSYYRVVMLGSSCSTTKYFFKLRFECKSERIFELLPESSCIHVLFTPEVRKSKGSYFSVYLT